MPEILTESFCERCGTRYTFEAAAPSKRRLGRLRVVSRGLKNYVLSDESSLEEAFAEARSDDERAVTSQQLDAFHQTFNFCMSCRQYTCANCWNAVEARCLTCAPHLGHEVLPAPFPTLDPGAGVAAAAAPGSNGHAPDEAAWPAADLITTPAAELSTAPGADLAPDLVLDVPAAEARPAQPPDASTDHRAAVAAAETAAFLSRFRPGESLDRALEAYEEESATAAEAASVEIIETAAVAADTEALEAVAADTEALEVEAPPATGALAAATAAAAAEVARAEEPIAAPAAPEPAPAAETEAPEKPARLAAAAAAWRVVAPDDEAPAQPPPGPTPAWPPLPPGTEAPQWPATPISPAAVQASRANDLLWAESSRDVLSPPAAGQRAGSAVQPCVSCGLALSSTARFCRRCGSPQG